MNLLIIYLTVFIIVPVIFTIKYYNKFIILRNYTQEAFSTMDVYLKKRWDLIPNLIETIKNYMQHEKQILEKLTELRNINYELLTNKDKIKTNNELALGLSNLIATAENYPDLKANESFNKLINELTSVENDIANARKYYNGTVREYNTSIQQFPGIIFANIFNFKKENLFKIEVNEKDNIKVEF